MPGHMPWVGSHIGSDGIRKFVGDLDAHLIFKHFAADHLYADAECGAVFVRGCAVCTARATGRSYQDSFVHFLGFRNLKLTHFRELPGYGMAVCRHLSGAHWGEAAARRGHLPALPPCLGPG